MSTTALNATKLSNGLSYTDYNLSPYTDFSSYTIKSQDLSSYLIKTTTEIKLEELENKIKALEEKITTKKEEENTSMKEEKKFAYDEVLNLVAPYITKVEILKPEKVLRFTFSDDTVIKTVCVDNDAFDFKFAFFLAYAKYFWKNVLTIEGIENKAKDFTNIKFFNSLVKKGMKVYFNQKKEEERKEKEEAERKKIKANRIAKKIAKKKKAREDRINEIAEAIKRTK